MALVNFDWFISITDLLGSVNVVNKHESSSRGHDFAAGEITLQSYRALVANPARFTGFIADLAKHLTLDKGLTNAEMRTIGLSLRLTSNDEHSLQAPIAGFAKINGQSVDVVDPADIKELAVAMQTDGMADYAANQ